MSENNYTYVHLHKNTTFGGNLNQEPLSALSHGRAGGGGAVCGRNIDFIK